MQWASVRYWLVVVSVLLFLIDTLTSIYFLIQKFRTDQTEVRGSGLWLSTEVEREYRQLLHALTLYSLGEGNVSHDDLLLRFDVLWSQIINLREGKLGRHVVEISDSGELVEDVFAAINSADPRIQALDRGDRQTGSEIHAYLSAYMTPISQMSQRVDKWEQQYLVIHSDEAKRSLQILVLLVLGMAISGTVIVVLIVLETRRANHLFQTATIAEQGLREANDTLEERIQDRTAELKKALLEAEEANHAKSQFLAAMSHELRTPLNAIIGFSEMMAFGLPGDPEDTLKKNQEYAKDIGSSGQILLSLVDDILDLSAVEAGKRPLNIEPLALAQALGKAVHDLRGIAEDNGIDLQIAADSDGVNAYADDRALHQIMMNILSNSLKFTPSGGQVRVSTAAQGDRAVIRVEDTGTGIAAEKMETIFEPFSHSQTNAQIASKGA